MIAYLEVVVVNDEVGDGDTPFCCHDYDMALARPS
jgi:hypothetical protein